MKKVLILAYDFPPYNSIGAQRPYAWYKYSHEFGLYPVAITRQWRDDVSSTVAYCSSGYSEQVDVHTSDDGEIHYVPYNSNYRDKQILNPGNVVKRFLAKTMSGLQVMTELFCFAFDNKKAIYRYADEWLKNNTVDYILVSGEPFVLFRYARLLSKKHQIPWVGDYRDGWSWNYNRKNPLMRYWLSVHEKRISATASLLTSVSVSFKRKLRQLFPRQRIEVIYNGYFEELFADVKPEKEKGFTMAFSGTLYPYQPIEMLFDALARVDLSSFPQPVNLVFYGLEEQPVQKQRLLKAAATLDGVKVVFTKRLPQNVLINKLSGADMLILPANPRYPQIYAKVFEYLALGKPILYFKPDNADLNAILAGMKQVYACEKYSDFQAVFSHLKDLKHRVATIETSVAFSRKKQVQKLVPMLRDLSFFDKDYIVKKEIQKTENIKKPPADIYPIKKVLILAYDFPPYVSVGGLRPYSWYKYFHESGVYPVVVTRQWGNKFGNHLDYIAPGESDETIDEESETGTIIRTAYKPILSNRLLRKTITAWYEFIQFLFFVGPKSGLFRAAKRYLKNNKVDAIIATGEPFILFKYAAKLSKKHNIPWIADYRDPWSQNKSRSPNYLRLTWNKFFEKKYLANVHFITTVSDYSQHQISLLIKNKPFHIIPNGFNLPADYDKKAFTPTSDKLRIAFTGSVYPWHPWKAVLKCLSNLLETKTVNFEVSFYGINKTPEIKQYLADYFPGLENHVRFYAKLENQKLLVELSKHHALLLFNDYSVTGTKIYDYLAVKRRILLCFTNDKEALELKKKHYPLPRNNAFSQHLQKEIIAYTGAGYAIGDKDDLRDVLMALHQELQETGAIKCHSVNVEGYSRKKQAEKLAALTT